MKLYSYLAVMTVVSASCSEMQFNRETNRSAAIDGVLSEESIALAQAYAEALNEGNDTSLALTGEQPLSQSKIKRFRTALYQRAAKPQASLAEGQNSEELVVEMAEQVSLALSDAGISGSPAVLAPISQVSLNYTDLSKSSLERVMSSTLLAAQSFSQEDGQSLLKQIISRSNETVVPKLLRAMMSSSDQLAMSQEELIYNFASHMDGQPQGVVADTIVESLDLMEQFDVAATKPVKGFRDSVDPEVQSALAEVFQNLDAAAAAAAVGRKLIDANRNLDELNESLTKAKALAKAMAKKSKEDKAPQKTAEPAAAAAAVTAVASSSSSEVVAVADPPAGDTTAPVLHATTPFAPADGANSVALNSDLVIKFSENVVAGTGNIVLKSGVSVVQTIAATTTSITDDTATIAINDLSIGTSYYVLVDADAFEDAAGNSFAGISSASDWNFDAVAATVATFDFSNAGDYSCESGACNSANIEVSGGSASLKILDLTTDSSSEITAGTSNGISASGDSLALTGIGNSLALSKDWTPNWDSLVLHYKFDGNFNDSSGNANHATAYGNAGFSTESRIGSHSATFDGSGDYLDTGWQANVGATDALTIMFWMKSGTGNTHIGGASNTSPSSYFRFLFSSGGYITAYLRANDGSTYDIPSFYTDGELNTDLWEFYAMVYDGPNSKAHAFLNGRLENTKDFPAGWPDLATGRNFYIGTYNFNGSAYGSNNYNGEIDEFAIFDAAFTPEEIQRVYQHQRSAFGGSYTSKVFDVGQNIGFDSVAASSPLPYGKPITPNIETTATYSGILNSSGNGTVNQGLVALYHFDENSGTTAYDASGNSHHATKTGTGTLSEVGHAGRLGRAWYLYDWHYQVAHDTDFDTAHFTVGAWIHPNTNQFGSSMKWRGIAAKGHHGSNVSRWNFRHYYNASFPNKAFPAIALGFADTNIGTSGIYEVYADTPFNPGRWNHIFATFDGTTVRLYLDGVLIKSATQDDDGDTFAASALASETGDFKMGGYGFDGLVDELGVWNRALSAAEIKELYLRGANRFEVRYRTCTSADCSDQDASAYQGWNQTTGINSGLSELQNHTLLSSGDPDYSTGNTNAAGMFYYLPGLGATHVGQPAARRYLQYDLKAFSHDENSLCSGSPCMPLLTSVSLNSRAGNVISGAIDGPYPASKPELVNGTAVAFSTLTSMSITSSGNVKFAVSNDGGTSFKYWDGSAWAAAGAGVGASATDTSSNISSMAGGNMVVKVIFETDGTGSTGGSVSNITLTGI